MKISDLIKDSGTNMVSHTKLWANVAYLTSTYVVVSMAINNTLTPDMFLIYLGVVGAGATASKLLSLKYGGEK